MARLGFGAVEPTAGMAAIGRIMADMHSNVPPLLLASVFYWDRSALKDAFPHDHHMGRSLPCLMSRNNSYKDITSMNAHALEITTSEPHKSRDQTLDLWI